MSDIPTIVIRMGTKCAECRKGGAANNGLCMSCSAKALNGTRMRSERGRAVAIHMKNVMAEAKRK